MVVSSVKQTTTSKLDAFIKEREIVAQRLELYLAREAEMLKGEATQMYSLGTRSAQKHQTPLAMIQQQIEKLQTRLAELDEQIAAESCAAIKTRLVVIRDW